MIHTSWVLSAAHCFHGRRNPIEVLLGGTNRYHMSYSGFVTARYDYPHFRIDDPSFEHDLLMLKIPRVTLGPGIALIPISTSIVPDSYVFQASGFGNTWTGSAVSDDLLRVRLRQVDHDTCQNIFSMPIRPTTICVKWVDHFGASSCQGDSGGPLIVWNAFNQPILYGVFSFTPKYSCHHGLPVGYTMVNYYMSWFSDVINDSSYP